MMAVPPTESDGDDGCDGDDVGTDDDDGGGGGGVQLPRRHDGAGDDRRQEDIRSSIMSHITFKMCQFVLVIYLRDYHHGFYLDIVVLWSFYGVL